MKANAKLQGSLAVVVLLVLAGVGLLLRAYRQIEVAATVRQQGYVESLESGNCLSALKDAETGYRGYLLTRDETYLQPYLAVRDSLGRSLAALRRPDLSPPAREHLDAVVSLVPIGLERMELSIGQCRKGALPPAAMRVRIGEGKQWMDRIRTELEAFRRIEADAQVRYDAAFQARLRTLLGIIWASGLLTLGLGFLFAYLFHRDSHRRNQDRFLLETRRLLEGQKALNAELTQASATLAESQDKLRGTEESFRLMVESVVDCALVMLDPEGRVQTWNSGAQRIKGFTQEDILGQHFSRFYTPADVALGLPQQALDLAAANGRCERQGWRVRKDGSLFFASVIVTAIRDPAGALRGFAKLTMDLSERRKVEQELQEARRIAEDASLAKSNFLSSMSHELRTPLNAILGFAQLMETDRPPPRPSQEASLRHILKSGWHLLTLINEVLDLSRIESGQMGMSQEPVALAELLAECQGMIGPQAAGRGLTLDFPPPSLRLCVLGDRTRVKQVLLNLLSNAIKYNAREGLIEVRCSERVPGRVRVAIRDTGPGLRPEQVAQLFQPFNRLEQGAGLEEGSGIGLVLAKRLVELMGGGIGVDSCPGVGSEFWFELPAAAAPGPAPEAGPPGFLPGPSGSTVQEVLYVEDNPANLALVEQILARHPGLRLLTATDGPSGIALARKAQPKVILMDINLPGMSGFEALHRLRADPATAAIPVLAISANAMTGERERGLAAGFADYLTKPIKLDELMAAILAALA